MKIGIIGAMEEEIIILKDIIKGSKETFGKTDIYSGKIFDHEVFLVKSGIGTAAAAISTSILILKKDPDLIINTGSAGGIKEDLKVGDLVLASSIAYHSADVTAFGYKKGQLPGCPETFNPDKKYNTIVKTSLGSSIKEGLICSGDEFCGSKAQIERIKKDFPNIMAIEMEIAAVAQGCYIFNKPFIMLRAISDNANDDANVDFKEFLDIASKESSKAIIKILEAL
ncbi:MAG: 5'-methylthioadenosine/adenosylhomocysteine nucleosidase [Psittacicella sp.]